MRTFEIVEVAPFRVAGFYYHGPVVPGVIGAHWHQSGPIFDQLSPIGVAWGLSHMSPANEGAVEYLGGFHVASDAPVPADATAWDCPGGRYAKINIHISEIQDVIHGFFRQDAASNHLTHRPADLLEEYPSDFDETMRVNLYFAIE